MTKYITLFSLLFSFQSLALTMSSKPLACKINQDGIYYYGNCVKVIVNKKEEVLFMSYAEFSCTVLSEQTKPHEGKIIDSIESEVENLKSIDPCFL